LPDSPEALPNGQLNRPVIIVAAPRSGSTFLFEMLSKSVGFYTIGGESHGVIEGLAKFNLTSGFLDSNKITADDLDDDTAKELRSRFYAQLRDSENQPLTSNKKPPSSIRFLEKTPKNSLRIGMLNKLYPDALFIYLYRAPIENISSIIDAWQSGRFVTYPRLPGRAKPWSLLLPKKWQNYHHAPVEKLAQFQWMSANQSIVNSLSELPSQRWTAISYSQLMENTANTLDNLCEFCGITTEGINAESGKQQLSIHTLTPPKKNKWHKNATKLAAVLPDLSELLAELKTLFPKFNAADFENEIDPTLLAEQGNRSAEVAGQGKRSAEVESLGSGRAELNQVKTATAIGRNDPCHCQSGKRFKHCHGSLN